MYTKEEINKLAEEEQQFDYDMEFQELYDRLVPEKSYDAKDIGLSSITKAELFAKWGKEKGLPIYHVTEHFCSISKSFSALANHEKAR